MKATGIPKHSDFRKLPKSERRQWTTELRRIHNEFPLVDRSDDSTKGGRFVMSLCEGETIFMKHKSADEIGYFVVAKLDNDKRNNSVSIVVVPHWDARPATARKDTREPKGKKKIPDSKRDQFSVTPRDLKTLAPPGYDFAVKVRVTPLGKVIPLAND